MSNDPKNTYVDIEKIKRCIAKKRKYKAKFISNFKYLEQYLKIINENDYEIIALTENNDGYTIIIKH